jgi:hypothetical protein
LDLVALASMSTLLQKVSLLKPKDESECKELIREGILSSAENVVSFYKGVRDMLVVTSKRLLLVDKQGLTGKKQKFTTIPLSQICAYSVETGGTIDIDCDIYIHLTGLGHVHAQILRPTKNIDPLVKALNSILIENQ